jgi:hypothetical protein
MATATRATGRAHQAPGESLARTRAASQNLRDSKRMASARRPIQRNVTMLQAVLIDNAHRSHAKINRQPCRLEITATHTKQKPATQINRQQIATSRITHPSISNRHSPRLENAISHRKRTRGALSNRHFLQVSECHQHRIAATARPPRVASNIVSNRQSRILEFTKSPTKTPLSRVLIDTKSRFLRPRQGLGTWVRGSRFHGSQTTPLLHQ